MIDAHVHLRGTADLEELARWGVTTALDMGSWPPALIAELRKAGSSDVRSTGAGALGPGSPQAMIPGRPADSVILTPEDGRRFVAIRVAEGMDYIKVIVEAPGRGGLDLPAVRTIVEAAHDAGRLVVAHASHTGAVATAQEGCVDVLTHAPLDAVLDQTAVADAGNAGRARTASLNCLSRRVSPPPRPCAPPPR